MKNYFLVTILTLLIACGNPENENKKNNAVPVKKGTERPAAKTIEHYTAPDLSPMDMIYYPAEYPLQKMSGKISTPPLARIIYSRPQKQGRKIFGELIKYNQPWRLGANEATELELFSPVSIQNKIIPPGRYVLYCIPQETRWTLVLNSNLYSWGLQQDRSKDFLKLEVPVEKNNSSTEYFTMAFEGSGKDARLLILWEDVRVTLPLKF